MSTRKIEGFLWTIMCFILVFTVILHPRLHYMVLLFVAAVKCVNCFAQKENHTIRNMLSQTVFLLIAMTGVGYMTKLFDGVIPYHAPYEYQTDLHELRMQYGQEKYLHFPDELPDGAYRVVWRCVPSLMQGTHSEDLFFYADQEYISELYEYYASHFPEYHYDKEIGWMQLNGEDVIFPNVHNISPEEMLEIKAFVIYDQEGHDHHQSGLYLNAEKGYICFYSL